MKLIRKNKIYTSACLELGRECKFDKKHAMTVERVAGLLFGQLKPLHRLGSPGMLLLRCGALLHDIGWINGAKNHHKASRDIILNASSLPFSGLEKMIVAMLARYHRKAIPANNHKYYSQLSAENKIVVKKLSGILRLADGLCRDRKLRNPKVKCRISAEEIILTLAAGKKSGIGSINFKDKADLARRVFGRGVTIVNY